MRAQKQDRIASLLECSSVPCPGIPEYILRSRFQLLRNEALEAIRAARTMAIHDNYLSCSCCPCPAHSSIHLVCIQFPALLIESCARSNLIPMLYTGDALHITKNNDAHNIPLFE